MEAYIDIVKNALLHNEKKKSLFDVLSQLLDQHRDDYKKKVIVIDATILAFMETLGIGSTYIAFTDDETALLKQLRSGTYKFDKLSQYQIVTMMVFSEMAKNDDKGTKYWIDMSRYLILDGDNIIIDVGGLGRFMKYSYKKQEVGRELLRDMFLKNEYRSVCERYGFHHPDVTCCNDVDSPFQCRIPEFLELCEIVATEYYDNIFVNIQ